MTLEENEKPNRPDCGQIIKSGMPWVLSANEFEVEREISKLVISKNKIILILLIPILKSLELKSRMSLRNLTFYLTTYNPK
jgi:hypothetical protein